MVELSDFLTRESCAVDHLIMETAQYKFANIIIIITEA